MSGETETLPPFPVDDSTLNQIEHALGGCLTSEQEDGSFDTENPRVIGAEFTLSTLLDFMSGSLGKDPNGYMIEPGDVNIPGFGGAEVWMDTRVSYHEHDLIRALIAEVRRLRDDES